MVPFGVDHHDAPAPETGRPRPEKRFIFSPAGKPRESEDWIDGNHLHGDVGLRSRPTPRLASPRTDEADSASIDEPVEIECSYTPGGSENLVLQDRTKPRGVPEIGNDPG